jgi:hypothetical protein
MEEVHYTRHAREKFEILKRHGFEVMPGQVVDTLRNPDLVIPQPPDKFIAQKSVSAHHVLWVVYRMRGETYLVITFYPGRKERYESNL